jgi:hypothetical protein
VGRGRLVGINQRSGNIAGGRGIISADRRTRFTGGNNGDVSGKRVGLGRGSGGRGLGRFYGNGGGRRRTQFRLGGGNDNRINSGAVNNIDLVLDRDSRNLRRRRRKRILRNVDHLGLDSEIGDAGLRHHLSWGHGTSFRGRHGRGGVQNGGFVADWRGLRLSGFSGDLELGFSGGLGYGSVWER